MFLRKISFFILCGILGYSCGDEDLVKFDNIDGIINWTPNVDIPIGHGDFTIWKFVNQADTNIIEKDNQVLIRHWEEGIYKLNNIEDIINLPKNIANNTVSVPIPAYDPGSLTDIVFPVFTETSAINFTEGSITHMTASMDCYYSFPQTSFGYSAVITLENVNDVSGNPVQIRKEIGEVPVSNVKKTLSNITFNMGTDPGKLKWKVEITVAGGQTIEGDKLDFDFSFQNFSFQTVTGTLNTKYIPIDQGNFDVDVDFWKYINGDLHFVGSRIDLIAHNYGVGVPLQLDMHLTAYGDGKTASLIPLNGYKPTFEGWTPLDQMNTVSDTAGYDDSNSNIADLLSLPPKDRIVYGGQVIVNPDPAHEITIKSTGKVDVSAYIEIPLHLSAQGLMFNDTINDIDISDADKILKARLRVTSTNYIPLALTSGNLLLLDESYQCIDSVKVNNFIDAPAVDANGIVVLPVEEKVNSIELSETNIKSLVNTKYIVISVKAETSKNGAAYVPVVLNADAKLQLKIGLEAKLDLKDL